MSEVEEDLKARLKLRAARVFGPGVPIEQEALDRIIELEAENRRLREALARVHQYLCALQTVSDDLGPHVSSKSVDEHGAIARPIRARAVPMAALGDMTLRDWLAGQALAGLLANSALEGSYEGAALGAYAAADAMLAQREQASAGSKPKLQAHRCHECDRPMAVLATYRTEDGRKICGDCWLLERASNAGAFGC